MTDVMDRQTEATGKGSRFGQAHHILMYFIGGAAVIWLLTGFYQLRTDQVAIVERLGQYLPAINGREEHGLHYHMPWPVDRVNLISTQLQYRLPVNVFNTSPAEYADFKIGMSRQADAPPPQVLDALFDPYVITADKSVVHLEINVLFTIKDPLAWLVSVSHEYSQDYDPKSGTDMRTQLFQQIAQRAMVAQTAQMTLDRLLGTGRAELQKGIQKAFEDALNSPSPAAAAERQVASLGVDVVSVTLSEPVVPDAVKPAYQNLVSQLSRAQTVATNAETERNSAITRAEGEKSTLLADAETYKQNTVQAATGEASRFSEVLKQYEKSPVLTRINMAVDAGRTVYGAATRIVFAQPGQKTSIVIDPPQYNPAATQRGQ